MQSRSSQNISPLTPGVKKCLIGIGVWKLVLPGVVSFLEISDILMLSSGSKMFRKNISCDTLLNKAGLNLFGRACFHDPVRLRESILELETLIRSPKPLRSNSKTCIRCIDFIHTVVGKWHVSYATFELSVVIVIRFLERVENVKFQPRTLFEESLVFNHILLGSAAVFIASKFRDACALSIQQILVGNSKTVSAADVLGAEESILHNLPDWVEIDQHVTYLAKLIPKEFQNRVPGKRHIDSALPFIENSAIKCFSFPIPGILKALAISLITLCVDSLKAHQNFSAHTLSDELSCRLNSLTYLFLVGDCCLSSRHVFSDPPIACFILNSIFDYMERDMNDSLIGGSLNLAVRNAEQLLLQQIHLKWASVLSFGPNKAESKSDCSSIGGKERMTTTWKFVV